MWGKDEYEHYYLYYIQGIVHNLRMLFILTRRDPIWIKRKIDICEKSNFNEILTETFYTVTTQIVPFYYLFFIVLPCMLLTTSIKFPTSCTYSLVKLQNKGFLYLCL
jgi:hypothetical protein